MHATFLMLHLGALAPVEALAAWLLFGGVVGATSFAPERERAAIARGVPTPGVATAGGLLIFAAVVLVSGWVLVVPNALSQPASGAQRQVLASGPAKALPSGAAFVSVIELPQAPGAKLGPHAHIPGFAYVLQGRETIAFPGQPTQELHEGDGGFMGALAIHAHENRQRLPAAAVAVGLLAIGVAISITSLTLRAIRRGAMAALAVLLIAAAAVALWDPWANDWYFIGIRPATARGGVMPLPNASRIYESPDLKVGSEGPYTETLQILSVPAGGQFTVEAEPGPETFLVLSGRGAVELNDDDPISLGSSEAALAQEGMSVRLSNVGDETLSVLSFSLVASGGSQ
jgi:quercetin dioxygenase-like cupin family protein